MYKIYIYICCVVFLFFSCNEGDTYRIKVQLSNLKSQDVYAVFESVNSKSVDTLSVGEKGEFVVARKQDNFRTVTFYYENFTRWITVYLEKPQRIVVTGDAYFPQLVQIKGGRINELLSGFRKETSSLQKEFFTLLNGNDTIQEKLNVPHRLDRLANINHALCLQAEEFIENNPSEKASAILIRDFFLNPDNPIQIDDLIDILDPQLADFYVVRELKAYAEKAKRTIVGSKAPNFNVRNIYGNTFDGDSFSDHYFLLAFTSMWNDECHTKELKLDEIISLFPKDSLSVMIVSLDEDPRELRAILREDPIKWNLVTDSVGQAIELLDLYNVNVLPRCFLIDKEGYIILKTESGVELRHELEQLFQ
jgi:Peroxiredoxin